jgi:hypothetical protein
MRKKLGGLIFICAICPAAFGIKISTFEDAGRLVEKAKDIVMADCVSIPTNKPVMVDGHLVDFVIMDDLYKVEVRVIRTLKGDKQPGNQIIATVYPMTPGKRYLLYSLGGEVGESGGPDRGAGSTDSYSLGGGTGKPGGIPATDFLAVPKFSVVEIPSDFDLKSLDGKDVKEQVQSIFSRHLFEVERELAGLLEEKSLLEKVTADRQSEWYKSETPLKIGPVIEAGTTNRESFIWLDLAGKKLQWSHSTPGKTGFLYFSMVGVTNTFEWEFSPCGAGKIEDLSGASLKARFYGEHTPGRGDTKLGVNSGNAILVSVGQVLLARTADDPGTIFIIQIAGQDAVQEKMSVRYTVIHVPLPNESR